MNILLPVASLLFCIGAMLIPAMQAITLSFSSTCQAKLYLFPSLAVATGCAGLILAMLNLTALFRKRTLPSGRRFTLLAAALCGAECFLLVLPQTPPSLRRARK